MRHSLTIVVTVMMTASALSPNVLAASAEQVGSVTILRGGGTSGPQTTPAEPGSGSSSGPASARFEHSADWNAIRTGSGNAGGIITNPPPGAGR